MVRQIKLSMWDALSHYVTGFTIMLSIYLHGAAKSIVPEFECSESKAAMIGFVGILLPYVVGLLFEPVANLVEELLKKWLPLRLRKLFGLSNDKADKEQAVLADIAKRALPAELRDHVNVYHWCKDYLIQKGADTPYMVFLAKFGFYRNMGCLFFMNALAVAFLHWRCWLWASCMVVCCIVLGIIYYRRSATFFRNLGNAMYNNYLIALNCVCEKKSNTTAEK